MSCPHLRVYQSRQVAKDILFRQSIDVLRHMQETYPDIRFRLFHIPEKGETFRRRYAINIVQEMQKLEMEYVPLLLACDWRLSHYHKHDGHPNDSGYQHLAECMEKYLY